MRHISYSDIYFRELFFRVLQKILILSIGNVTTLYEKKILLLCASILILCCKKNASELISRPVNACNDRPVKLIIDGKSFCSNNYIEFQKVNINDRKIDVFIWYSADGSYDNSKQMYYLHMTSNYMLNSESEFTQVLFGDWAKKTESIGASGKIIVTDESNDSISGTFNLNITMPDAPKKLIVDGTITKLKNL